jgi:hypothetical protein
MKERQPTFAQMICSTAVNKDAAKVLEEPIV